jgi:hypothetical protein
MVWYVDQYIYISNQNAFPFLVLIASTIVCHQIISQHRAYVQPFAENGSTHYLKALS